jgi:hypothetical protein
MPRPWISSIRTTGLLSYYIDSSVSGTWSKAVDAALVEFERASRHYKFGVKMVASKTVPSDSGGAEIQFATANGTAKFSYRGEFSIEMSGTALKAYTRLVRTEEGPTEKAYIFLPATPLMNSPSGQRQTGAGVMQVMALHELIHACGLENEDHTPGDIFDGNPQPNPGNRPSDDHLDALEGSKRHSMPPILWSIATIKKIKAQWS